MVKREITSQKKLDLGQYILNKSVLKQLRTNKIMNIPSIISAVVPIVGSYVIIEVFTTLF